MSHHCRSGLRQVVDSMYEAMATIGEGGLYQPLYGRTFQSATSRPMADMTLCRMLA